MNYRSSVKFHSGKRILSLLLAAAMVVSLVPTVAFAAPVAIAEDLMYDRLAGLTHPRPIAEHYLSKPEQYGYYTELSPENEWAFYSFVLAYNEYVNLKVYKYTGGDDDFEAGEIYPGGGMNMPPFDDSIIGEEMGYLYASQWTGNLTFDPSQPQSPSAQDPVIGAVSNRLTGAQIQEELGKVAQQLASGELQPEAMKEIFTYAFRGYNAPASWGVVPPGGARTASNDALAPNEKEPEGPVSNDETPEPPPNNQPEEPTADGETPELPSNNQPEEPTADGEPEDLPADGEAEETTDNPEPSIDIDEGLIPEDESPQMNNLTQLTFNGQNMKLLSTALSDDEDSFMDSGEPSDDETSPEDEEQTPPAGDEFPPEDEEQTPPAGDEVPPEDEEQTSPAGDEEPEVIDSGNPDFLDSGELPAFDLFDPSNFGPSEPRLLRTGGLDFTGCIHNYFVWDGRVITEGGEVKPLEDGKYVIKIEPTNPITAAYPEYLPFGVQARTPDELKDLADYWALFETLIKVLIADPVDMATGSFGWSYTDLQLEGAAPLTFTRVYESTNSENNIGLGNGWSHSFLWKLEALRQYAKITMPTGSTVYIETDFNGQYMNKPGAAWQLHYDGSGYVFEHESGEKVYFDADGHITRTEKPNSDVMEFETDGDGNVTKVSNRSGSMTFAYSGGNLTRVTDSAGRSVDFTYAGDDLVSAKNPDTDTLRYQYDNSRLTQITDFNGTVYLKNEYDEKDRVTRQFIEGQGDFTFTYGENQTTSQGPNGLTKTVFMDKDNRIIAQEDNDGREEYIYDDMNRLVGKKDRRGYLHTYEYEGDTTRKVTTAYPDGTTELFVYNDKGQVTQMTQTDGSTLGYEYDGNGNLAQVTDANGGVRTFVYDDGNRLVSSSDALGNTTTYTTNDAGLILTMTDPLGNTLIYTYDDVGRVAGITSPLGNTTTFAYTEGGKLITETDALGNTRSYEYTPNGYETSVGDWNGNNTQYAYNAQNQKILMTDAEGRQTQYTYDEAGNLASSTDPDGHTVRYTYDPVGRIASMTDGNGNTTSFTYDENGNLTATVDPLSGNTSAVYDELNRVVSEKNKRGAETVYTRDEMGRVLTATDPEGGVTSYAYDAMGRVVKAVNEDGAVTQYTRDAKGRITAIKDAHGNFRYLEYDPMDRITADTDENGVRRTYEYDAKGNLIKYTDGLGYFESYEYDGNDRMTKLTDRKGLVYTYEYDALNRIVSETNPLGDTKTFHYDKNSRIVGVTDRNGNKTTYVLDGNGNIVESIDAKKHSSFFEYDSMDRLTKVKLRRIDEVHNVDEIQETLYTYDHRGLVKTEVNAKGDGKVFVYDGNGNLVGKTDEDGYITEYEYSPVNLVSKASYADGKQATYLYDGTGDLIKMVDWVGETTYEYDLLDRLLNVNDHKNRNVNYVYDNVGNIDVIQYPDETQVDYYYDAENQMVEMVDFDRELSRFTYDPNGNVVYKEYPNYENAYYSYDDWNQCIQLDEYDLGGKKLFKTTYSWDAEGNRLSEMQYNHGQSGGGNGKKTKSVEIAENSEIMVPTVVEGSPDVTNEPLNPIPETTDPLVNAPETPDPLENTAAGIFILALSDNSANEEIINGEAGAPEANTPEAETPTPEAPSPDAPAANGNDSTPGNGGDNTGKDDATIEGNGDGNGQVPPGQTEDEDGGIHNPAGHYPPGLNKGTKPEKPDNPNKPDKPDKPGQEDSSDKKAQKGTHIYTYDPNNRVVTGNVAKTLTNYRYDSLGNLILESSKNTVIDYQYNNLNQLVRRAIKNDVYTFTYDRRGNRIAESGKKASQEFVFDATNHLVEGTNWKGDKSAYTYNGLFVRVNNTQTTHAGQVYDRDFVIDYNSFERNDLMVFSPAYYEQKHVYTSWGERMEMFTDRTAQSGGNGGLIRLLYVHEDIMGNTRYYTKETGQSFAELEYDVWGAPTSPSKLVNNDNGNFAAAVMTGHSYDTVLDIYFAEARFYDAKYRQWMASDPIKDGLNWYEYVSSNPATRFDPDGYFYVTITKGYWGDIEMYLVAIEMEGVTGRLIGGAVNDLTFDFGSYLWNEVVRKPKGAVIGNTFVDQSFVETFANALPDYAVDKFVDKVLEKIFKEAAESVGGIIQGISAFVSAGNSGDIVFNDKLIFEAMNESGFEFMDHFLNREDAEQEALYIYNSYLVAKEYLARTEEYWYFKPFSCLRTYYEQYKKITGYGEDTKKIAEYIKKQGKKYRDRLIEIMIKNDPYENKMMFGENNFDTLLLIADMYQNTYVNELNHITEIHNFYTQGLREVLSEV